MTRIPKCLCLLAVLAGIAFTAAPAAETVAEVEIKAMAGAEDAAEAAIETAAETEIEATLRSLLDEISGIRAQMAAREGDFAEIKSELARKDDEMAAIQAQLAIEMAKNEEIAAIREHLASEVATQSALAEVAHQLTAKDEEIAAIREHLASEVATQSALAEVADKLTAKDEEIAAIEARLASEVATQSALAEVAHKLTEKDGEIAAIEARLANEVATRDALGEVADKLTAKDEEIAAIEARLASEVATQSALAEVADKLTEKDGEIADIRDRLANEVATQSALAEVADKLTEKDEEIAGIRERLANEVATRDALAEVADKLTEKDGEIAAIEARMAGEAAERHRRALERRDRTRVETIGKASVGSYYTRSRLADTGDPAYPGSRRTDGGLMAHSGEFALDVLYKDYMRFRVGGWVDGGFNDREYGNVQALLQLDHLGDGKWSLGLGRDRLPFGAPYGGDTFLKPLGRAPGLDSAFLRESFTDIYPGAPYGSHYYLDSRLSPLHSHPGNFWYDAFFQARLAYSALDNLRFEAAVFQPEYDFDRIGGLSAAAQSWAASAIYAPIDGLETRVSFVNAHVSDLSAFDWRQTGWPALDIPDADWGARKNASALALAVQYAPPGSRLMLHAEYAHGWNQNHNRHVRSGHALAGVQYAFTDRLRAYGQGEWLRIRDGRLFAADGTPGGVFRAGDRKIDMYQLTGAVQYDLRDSLRLEVGYRHERLRNSIPAMSGYHGGAAFSHSAYTTRNYAHVLYTGLTIHWGGNPPTVDLPGGFPDGYADD